MYMLMLSVLNFCFNSLNPMYSAAFAAFAAFAAQSRHSSGKSFRSTAPFLKTCTVGALL